MLKKAFKWIGTLLLLIGMAGLGYLYYQYTAQAVVNKVIEQFGVLAKIEYTSLSVDLEGRIHLLDVRITPLGYRDTVTIQDFQIKSTSAWELMGASSWFRGSLPRTLTLRMSGIEMLVNSDFYSTTGLIQQDKKGQALWRQGCGPKTSLVQTLQALSYSQLSLSAKIEMQSSQDQQALAVKVAIQAPSLAKAALSVDLSHPQLTNFFDKNVLAQTKVQSILLNVSDLGFNAKRVSYCAKKEDIPERDYLKFFNAHVAVNVLAKAVEDDQLLKNSILAFFVPKANVVLRLEPKNTLLLKNLFSANYAYLLDQKLTLAVNKKQVSPRYLPLLNSYSTVVDDNAVAQAESVAAIKKVVLAREKVLVKPSYKDIPLPLLGNYTGEHVKLRTRVGKEIDGLLLEVSSDSIVLQRRIEQGMVVYPVKKSNIATIKSFR